MLLIVDDDKDIRMTFKLVLSRRGWDVCCVATAAEALERVRSGAVQAVVMDMNLTGGAVSGAEGIELLRRIKVLQPRLPVVLMTAWSNVPLAVEGMRCGATDFVAKPVDFGALDSRLRDAIDLRAAAAAPASQFDPGGIICRSQAMLKVLETAARVAPTDAPVLILGENGTGKEMLARAIHRNSRRRQGPMVAVNLGGIPAQLFESEMFGYIKGAFTGAVADRPGRFALADKGTIFLDEIGDLQPDSQVKLLRVLQEHTFEPLGQSHPQRADFRVISATNARLHDKVADCSFREDLYYRINLITLQLPPLRQRPDDIPLLTDSFACAVARQYGLDTPQFAPSAINALKRHPLPGNVRQLRNIVERAILTSAPGREIDAAALDDSDNTAAVATADGSLMHGERLQVSNALKQAHGNVSAAAAALGITRQALYRRIAKHNISPDEYLA